MVSYCYAMSWISLNIIHLIFRDYSVCNFFTGTYIEQLGRPLKPDIGQVVSFCGNQVLHGGDPIIRGTRYIIVGFCYHDKPEETIIDKNVDILPSYNDVDDCMNQTNSRTQDDNARTKKMKLQHLFSENDTKKNEKWKQEETDKRNNVDSEKYNDSNENFSFGFQF